MAAVAEQSNPQVGSPSVAPSVAASALPKVIERCIRDNGREFEYGYRCDEDPASANQAARDRCAQIDFMRSPIIQKVGPAEWSVKWYGLD